MEPSARKGAESLALAASYLAEARATAGIGANRASFAAAYMVWFHAARAVLFRDGVREKSHHCLEVYLEAYVAAGRLEEERVLLFGRLRSRRHENQYSFGPAPADEEVAGASSIFPIRSLSSTRKTMRQMQTSPSSTPLIRHTDDGMSAHPAAPRPLCRGGRDQQARALKALSSPLADYAGAGPRVK